ncbi:serine/threonine-protein kinase [Nocardia sp. BMG111209]|uniref:serine/threonine-protein kinase n=1 Tax=Nocardia sp. BMG111209 TaxID=1160137 RepID=UPI00037A9C5F|nr:serine/threonine-protein kinase [Nocardia sp. BMG111209]
MDRRPAPDDARDANRTRPEVAAAELGSAGFEVVAWIGRGRFGAVYRCVDSGHLDVAVEVADIGLDEDDRARFLREPRAAGICSHPNIVRVLRVGFTAAGFPYLVTPFRARGTLEHRIRHEGALRFPEVLCLGVKLAGALAAGHAVGLVHGAVEPANIVFTDDGAPQLADFEIAGILHSTAVTASPGYAAPEVSRSRPATPAADLYGLGATMFAALTGHPPGGREHGESLAAQPFRPRTGSMPDERAAAIPAALWSAVGAATDRRPEDRPGSAREFAARLRDIQFAAGLTVDAFVAVAPARAPAPSGTGPAGAGVAHFRPPVTADRLVDRPRLLDTLRAGGNRRLVFVHGPPGYGKSTLAAQWAAELAAEGIPTTWLTVRSDDNNIAWGLSRFVGAVRQLLPNLAAGLARVLEEGSAGASQRVLTMVIDEIHRSGRTVAVVVDDWHRIRSTEAKAAMRYLLDHACHHLRLIVTSRYATGLPLAGLRAQDEVVEIDEQALRFDEPETEQLLLGIGGLPLSRPEAEHLRDTTEGWAAGLQLAALSMRGKSDLAERIDRISGHHRTIGRYLMENVVEEIEPDVLEFMMRTAVAETISGELAEALTGRPDAQDLLRAIHQRGLFLRSVDEEQHRFRYHSLFADFLRHRLAQRDPDPTADLHLVAAEWFAGQEMLTDAVDHFLAAGAPGAALRLVVDRSDALLSDSRMVTFLALVDKLPPAVTETDPRLQLAVAMAQLALLHLDAVRAAYDRARQLLAGRPADARTAELDLACEIAAAGLTLQSDRFRDLSPTAKQRLRLRPSLPPYIAGVGRLLLATTALLSFDFDEARRWRGPAPDTSDGQFLVVLNEVTVAAAAFEQLDVDDADRILRNVVSVALESGRWPNTPGLIAAAQLAELLYQTGQFAEADELLPAGEDIETVNVEILIASYGTAARLAAVRGRTAEAEQTLAAGEKVAQALSLPRLSSRIRNEQIRLGLRIAAGERTRLTHLGTYRPQPDQFRASRAEMDQDSAVRILLAERSPASIRQATQRAEEMSRQIRSQRRPRALLQAQLLFGGCLAAGGRTADAIDQLTPALQQCAQLGLVRFAVDNGGPSLASIAETLYGAPRTEQMPSRQFLQRILDEIESNRARRAGLPDR